MYTKKTSLSTDTEPQGDLTRMKVKNTNVSFGTCASPGRVCGRKPETPA